MTMPNNAFQASCLVALAAYLQDMGKFAERACGDTPAALLSADGSQTLVSYAARAFDIIAKHAPHLIDGDETPSIRISGAKDAPDAQGHVSLADSLANVAASQHQPETFLQWVLATADRLAGGIGQTDSAKHNAAEVQKNQSTIARNQYQARMLSLLEQIDLSGKPVNHGPKSLLWRYPLKALSAQAIFPQPRDKCEPSKDESAHKEYAALWEQFLQAIESIPVAHRQDWGLWLDHFDTAWLTFAHAIPSATASVSQQDVSLYDHSKTSAALAVALWRWHQSEGSTDAAATERMKGGEDWNTEKILLIQGDFFGIQDFIFADGSQTRKDAARLLRGRSFQVSIFTELAALKVLDALALPPTSQITNAAGKFLIVAPNTAEARSQLEAVRKEINAWFLQHSFGLAGMGLVAKAACCNDFLDTKPSHRFKALMDGLFADLERAKLQRFDLTGSSTAVFDVAYPQGVCIYNDRLPADQIEEEGRASAALSRDQIVIGKSLSLKDRLLVLRGRDAIGVGGAVDQLEVPIFGYTLGFTGTEDASGKFGPLARRGVLARCWDFSLPETMGAVLWNGYARRYINAYVPRFCDLDIRTQAKYKGLDNEVSVEDVRYGAGKTLNHIACEDRQPISDKTDSPADWQGQVALMTLKGDVDNLGSIFQKGLQAPTFAKMAALSRQMNAFFAVYLPALCETDYQNTYTVFAGGDDFFLIGPWHSTQRLAARMAESFKTYVSDNPAITFSAGMVMTKPGLPMHTLAAQAEDALDEAKAGSLPEGQRKNAVLIFGERVRWGAEWAAVQSAHEQLERVRADYSLSTSYVYGLLHLIDLATDTNNPEHAMWRSRFAYRTRRYVVDKIRDPERRAQAQKDISVALGEQGINQLGTRYRIPLFNHFYRQR